MSHGLQLGLGAWENNKICASLRKMVCDGGTNPMLALVTSTFRFFRNMYNIDTSTPDVGVGDVQDIGSVRFDKSVV